MAKRQVFFSFEYNKDAWRASQVRNMGKVDNNSTFSDNDWEEVKSKKDSDIEKWIDEQMAKRSCLIVLIGKSTSGRKWINYEIKKAYELNKGIVTENLLQGSDIHMPVFIHQSCRCVPELMGRQAFRIDARSYNMLLHNVLN